MDSSQIKEILYSQINQSTESRIQREFSDKNHSKIVKEILDRCLPKISKLDGDSYEVFGIFAEGMMHYLLTNVLIPSQRKITIKNTELDIVIPDSRTLGSSPKDALVLHFVKTSNQDAIMNYLAKLQKIQPIRENIWLIAKTKLKTPFKSYEVDKSSLARILDDINEFLLSKPQSKFRIFKT